MLDLNQENNNIQKYIPILNENFISDNLSKMENYLKKYIAHDLEDNSLLPYDRHTFKTYLAFNYQGDLVIGGDNQYEALNDDYKLFGYSYLSIKRNRQSIHGWALNILKTYQTQQVKQAVIQQQMSLAKLNELAQYNSYNLCFTPKAYVELIVRKINFITATDINEKYLQASGTYFATVLLRKKDSIQHISIAVYLKILDYAFSIYLNDYPNEPVIVIKHLIKYLDELLWQDNFIDANTNEISFDNLITLARLNVWAGLNEIKLPLHYLSFLKNQIDILSLMPRISLIFTLKTKADLLNLIKMFNNQDWAKQFLVILLNVTCKFKIDLLTKANNAFLIDHIKNQYSVKDLATISKSLNA